MEAIGNIDKFKQKNTQKPQADSHLHSPAHSLAEELCQKLNDRKHFAMYLGMATRMDHQFLRKTLGEVLESPSVKSPGRLFSFLVKKNNPTAPRAATE